MMIFIGARLKRLILAMGERGNLMSRDKTRIRSIVKFMKQLGASEDRARQTKRMAEMTGNGG